MSQISKCPKLRVVLGYWEALGEVSELRYKNLLYSSSKRSYCNILCFCLFVYLMFFLSAIRLVSQIYIESSDDYLVSAV